ncbi:HAD family hydrolase [uncultured Roseobacter sp.]|uniref:HAD family hydrolase n=1 Tax=uncultured Roseobacter sp. TaxID=114847 RepID=UPI00260A62E0|nr:HAD family hydrolase [uncultured Roseobacter sp.]
MIVFDLDDTLYLERDFAFSGYRHVDAWVADNHGLPGFGATCRELFASGERRNIFDRACASHGISATPGLIAALVAEYRGHAPQISLCPDADQFLARTENASPFGLITDGPEHTQMAKVRALALDQRIQHIRATGSWPKGFGKPHPRAFEEMEQLAPPKAQMVYIADNPAKDFITPKARGWLTIQIRRTGAIHSPLAPDLDHAAQIEIQSMDELDAALPS